MEGSSEILFRTIVEQSPVSTQVFAPDGTPLLVNRAWERLFGVTLDNIPGYNVLQDQQLVASGVMPYLQRAFAGESVSIPPIKYEPEQTIPGVSEVPYRWVAASTYPIKDANGAVVQVVLMHEDVTERMQTYEVLEQRVAERTRELATLLDVSHNMASTLELQPLLGLILAQLKAVVDYHETSILLLEGADLVFLGYWGPRPPEEAVGRRFSLAEAAANRHVIECREPLIIPDFWDDSPLARSFRQVGADLDNPLLGLHSWMGVPLLHKERVIGMLGMIHVAPRYYTPRHADLALAVANQAAVAIENARLYERAQEVAVLKERQRLARELHDSVSQALYGIALGARTARTLLERDPAGAIEPLDYVLSLAEAGLAEMRSLIFELRPEALETEGLVAVLEKQVLAFQTRHAIAIDAVLGAEPDVTLAVKEAIYRIAQEALYNTVKHARATRVTLRLETTAQGISLEVRDNGVGFDPEAPFPGHLGLRTMRERAMRLNGTLSIDSMPDRGTCLSVRLPYRPPL